MSSKNSYNRADLTGLPTYAAGVMQSTTYRLLMKFTDAAVHPYGITSMQWFMIGTIYEAGEMGITIGELSKRLDTTMSYVTNTMNLLVSRNIIERVSSKSDLRSKSVHIHPSFVPKFHQIEGDLRKKLQGVLYVDITPAELLTYIKVLQKINSSLANV